MLVKLCMPEQEGGKRETAAVGQDCSLHPSEPLVAAALIDGRLIARRFDAVAGTHESSINLKVICSNHSICRTQTSACPVQSANSVNYEK